MQTQGKESRKLHKSYNNNLFGPKACLQRMVILKLHMI